MAKTKPAKLPHGVTQDNATGPIRNRRAPNAESSFDGSKNDNEDDHTHLRGGKGHQSPQAGHQGDDSDMAPKGTRIHLQELSIKYPDYMGQSMVSFLVFLMAATMRGKDISRLGVEQLQCNENVTFSRAVSHSFSG